MWEKTWTILEKEESWKRWKIERSRNIFKSLWYIFTNLKLRCNNFEDNSVEATIQVFFDVGLFDGFENKLDFSKCISLELKDEEELWSLK